MGSLICHSSPHPLLLSLSWCRKNSSVVCRRALSGGATGLPSLQTHPSSIKNFFFSLLYNRRNHKWRGIDDDDDGGERYGRTSTTKKKKWRMVFPTYSTQRSSDCSRGQRSLSRCSLMGATFNLSGSTKRTTCWRDTYA